MMINRSQEEITSCWETREDLPLVSIRCTVYNHDKYLEDCLNGFLIQKTTFPFEVFIHDDASTDSSASIIRKYVSKYPKIFKPFYEKENQYSKNDGSFRKITWNPNYLQGKYIAICEGDDYWTDPHKLQMQVDFLETNPNYSMCFHSAEIKFEGNLYTQAECKNVQDRDYTAGELLDHWVIPTASIVMRRECILFPLKKTSAIITGDMFTVFSCLSIGKIKGFSNPMSVYRVNQGSITYNSEYKKRNIFKRPENWECFKENFPFAPKHQVNKYLAFHYWQRASYQPTLRLSLQDRKKAIAASPLVSFLMIFRPMVIATTVFLSKFFDGEKIRAIVRKVTTKV